MSSDMPPIESIACVACQSLTNQQLFRIIKAYRIIQCRECGLRYVPLQDLTSSTANYDELYTEGSEYNGYLVQGKRLQAGELLAPARAGRRALEIMRREHPKTLLEIGCGVGGFLAWAQSMGIECCGADVSRPAVEIARTHLKGPVHLGPLTEEVFSARRFDVVCAWEVIEHVTDLQPFVRMLHSRLEAGGHLFLSTPNYESGWIWRTFEQDPRGLPPVHVTFWNRGSMQRYLAASGFSDVVVREYSVPLGSALESGMMLGRYLVVADAMLRPSQRQTLFVHARRRQ